MFSANESKTHQQFSAQDSSYLDRMAFPLLEKNYDLPYFPLPNRTPDAVFPGHAASNLPGPNRGPQDAVNGLLKPVHRYCNVSNPIGNLYPKDSQYALSHGPLDAPQKRFLIFDQSGDHKRLFFCPSFSPQGPILASKAPSNGPSDSIVPRVDQGFLMKPTVEEKWDENHLTDGEDEMMPEDTDEIDALLYSDSDDEYHDNDEVTSAMQSPSAAIEKGNTKDTSPDRELVASSHDNSPKRQRLPDGKYKKPSFESRANSSSQDDDVELSCRNPSYAESNKRESKVKIRQVLRILEAIIPGLDNKDPLSIIDRAVAYLKSMKTEAEALELGFPVAP